MSDKTYITFVDNAGRSILGSVVEDAADTVKIADPVMIIVQQQGNGQMAVQLYPLFFAEFIKPDADDNRSTAFVYSKSSIAVGTGFEVDNRIIEQYERIINPTLVPADQVGTGEEEPEVINLFDK